MAPTLQSPNVDNYQVGKGIVRFKRKGSPTFRDMGNVSALTVTPDMTTLEHFSSREGVKKKDKVVIIEKKCTVVLTFDEITPQNVAMALLGTVDEAAAGGAEMELFSENAVEGWLQFEGTNEVGPKVTVDLYNVSFLPNGDFGLISEEWNEVEITGDVLVAPADIDPVELAGKFGLMKWTNLSDDS